MKKMLLMGLTLGALNGCALSPSDSSSTTQFVAGSFYIKHSTYELASAIISLNTGLIRFQNGSHITYESVTPEKEQLDDAFDMRTYPRIALGLNSYTGSSAYFSEAVEHSVPHTQELYGKDVITDISSDGITTYAACKASHCIGYVTRDDVSSHVLMVLAEGVNKDFFIKQLKGNINVKR